MLKKLGSQARNEALYANEVSIINLTQALFENITTVTTIIANLTITLEEGFKSFYYLMKI